MDGGGGVGEIIICTTCCLRDMKDMETVKQSSIIQIKIVANAKGGHNYTMIRRAIFEKVHGHGVKEI